MVKHTFAVEVAIAPDGSAEFVVLNADVPLEQMVDCVTAYAVLIERLNPESPLAPVKAKAPTITMEAYL